MLEKLHLKNVGPAPELEMEFAPRVNIITGDNGLGKSFILDVAWWALIGKWLNEVNPRISSGQKARPSHSKEVTKSQISYSLGSLRHRGLSTGKNCSFDFAKQDWVVPKVKGKIQRQYFSALVIQACIDGEIGVFDPARTSYGFQSQEIWDGLEQNGKIVCNGLVRDWANWQRENGVAFHQLKSALRVLSPNLDEKLVPGALTRVSLDDARDIPTLKMLYGQEVPVIFASAGIRRVLSLAYMLVWMWQEHLQAAKLTRRTPSKEIVLLIDELEEHLHPRWQQVILSSILTVAKTIMGTSDVQIQIIAATHSPLVMASLEPLFDEKQDAWFDLNLVKGEVKLEKMKWRKRGGAAAWLRSEAFDLPSDENIQANAILEKASKAFTNAKLTKKKFLELDTELRNTLGEMHPFWIRWRFLGEQKGWL